MFALRRVARRLISTRRFLSSFSTKNNSKTSTTTSKPNSTPTTPPNETLASIDLGGSLSDHLMPKPFDLCKDRSSLGEDLGGSLGDSTLNIQGTLKSLLPRTQSRTLVTPIDDEEKVCPVSSRRRRLRETCSKNGLEVIRPLGRGSFGRIVLARRVEDGKYYAVKLQRLTGSELTPDQVATANLHKLQVSDIIEQLPEGFVREHFQTSLVALDGKLKVAGPKEGEYRLFDGQQSRRAVAESVILDHLQSYHPEYAAFDGAHTQTKVADGSTFVVQKHGSFEDREWVYITLDYLTGGTLDDRLKQAPGQKLKEDVAKFYLSELLMGLKYLRSKNVSHRDIKPANIMLDSQGHTVLMDFGLSTRTQKGLVTFCGTAEYIAPEVLTQKAWDATMLDTWSFGVLVHKLLTGITPFEAPTAKDVFMNILINDPLMGSKTSMLSEEAKSLIRSVLTRKVDQRATVDEIMEHSFFRGVEWDAVLRREAVPPWVPDSASEHALEDGIIHL
jgi:serine/threonine protein kinase